MAKSQNLSPISAFTEGFIQLPAFRQLGVLFGFAAVAALGVGLVLWSWSPSYGILFGSLGEKEASEVASVLQQRGINYKLDPRTGALLVPTANIHEIRLQLAAEGLPRSSGQGLEILQQKQEFGTSQFMESARYQHALEMELSRSIMTIGSVQSARVHLALPKQSVFVRKRQEPSASVLVKLYAGRILEEGQVSAISHLVASSVPNLEPQRVTVVDETGRLLSARQRSGELAMNQGQFEYVRNLETSFVDRIEDILSPIVGRGGVRAQVAADIDFSVTEQTMETFNPDLPALRSQEISEEQSLANALQGVPGALTNQPPGAGVAPEVAAGQNAAEGGTSQPSNTRRHSTSNYELDRTISHTRMSGGNLRRLSVAVVVKDRMVTNEQGETVTEPRSEEELERLTTLVRDAVGYNAQRGDTVNVISAAFDPVDVPVDVPPVPVWEQAWVLDLGKVLGALILGILLILLVLRPMMRNLSSAKGTSAPGGSADAMAAIAHGGGLGEDQLTLGSDKGEGVVKLPGPGAYEQNIDMIRNVVKEDPKRVAQVMRNWIAEDK